MFNFYFLKGKSLSAVGVVGVQAVSEGGRFLPFLKPFLSYRKYISALCLSLFFFNTHSRPYSCWVFNKKSRNFEF